ncbi:hypothetical protein EMIT0347P_10750 [Pseudomonas sp. IT-347P]
MNSGSEKPGLLPPSCLGERGLIEVFMQMTPTWKTEVNSGSEKPGLLPPSRLGERGLIEVCMQMTPT